MKTPVSVAALLAVSLLFVLPSLAQDDMGVPAPPPPPPPDNGPYAAQPDPNAPPPDQQVAPNQGAPSPDQQNAPDQNAQGPDSSAPGPDDQSASFQTFYDNLAAQGTWIQSSDYGYVWQPSVNDPEWAPYTNGHWVYSDVGWTWVSDESWGWATYHYGRWVNLDGTGWCWIPGYTWAPAWVSWRYGDGYCGWAPLPPDSFVGIDYGGAGIQISADFHIGGDCDAYFGIGPACYNFVPVSCLGYSNYRPYFANRHNNYAIINRTTNVTNIYVNRNGANGGNGGFRNVTAGGPSFAQVNASSQSPVQRVNLAAASRPGGGGHLTNNSLALYAPHVRGGAPAQPQRVGGSLGRATVNRGVDVNRPLAVNRNLVASAPTEGQIQQAQRAMHNAPANAKVMTGNAPANAALQVPLTSLTPIPSSPVAQIQGGNPYHQHAGQSTAAGAVASPNIQSANNGWNNHATQVQAPNTNPNSSVSHHQNNGWNNNPASVQAPNAVTSPSVYHSNNAAQLQGANSDLNATVHHHNPTSQTQSSPIVTPNATPQVYHHNATVPQTTPSTPSNTMIYHQQPAPSQPQRQVWSAPPPQAQQHPYGPVTPVQNTAAPAQNNPYQPQQLQGAPTPSTNIQGGNNQGGNRHNQQQQNH